MPRRRRRTRALRSSNEALGPAALAALALASAPAAAAVERPTLRSYALFDIFELEAGVYTLRIEVLAKKQPCWRHRAIRVLRKEDAVPREPVIAARTNRKGQFERHVPAEALEPGRYYVVVPERERKRWRCGPARSPAITVPGEVFPFYEVSPQS